MSSIKRDDAQGDSFPSEDLISAEDYSSNATDKNAAAPEAEMVCGYQLHPAAAAFPRLTGDDLEKFVDDIKREGLGHPIVLHPDDDSVLDGVNRLRACDKAGIEPKFTYWQGENGREVDFVITQNLARRHLSENQRAQIAKKLANMKQGRPGKPAHVPLISQADAAKKLKVGERTVRKAHKVSKAAPENIKILVEGDELSLDAGVAVAEATPAEKQAIAAMPVEEAKARANSMAREKRRKATARATAAVVVVPETSDMSTRSRDDDHDNNPRIGAEVVTRALDRAKVEADTPKRQAFVDAIKRLPLKDAAWARELASSVEQEVRDMETAHTT
jgi:hypothetical protein